MRILASNVQGVFCFLFMVLVVATVPSSALAHAEFQGSAPVANALLDELPTGVRLQFSEPVGALTLEWLLPDGTRGTATAKATPDGLLLSAPPATGRGTYVLNWRVVSADGHPIGGALVFSLGEVTGTTEPGTDAAVLPAIIARFLAILSMIFAVGAALYAALIGPLSSGAARFGRVAALAAVPLALVALGAYGLDLLGRGSSALSSSVPWQVAIAVPRGWGFLVGAAAAIIAGSRSRQRPAIALLVLVLGASSLAVSGHSSTGQNRWIGQPLMMLHAAALIFWVGGLPPLIASLSGQGGLNALRRFSNVALPAVIVLVATGVGLALIRGADIATLIASDWGKLLALKLVLVACMLALALLNKTRLTPALATAPGSARSSLRRSISAEIALGAMVLLVAMCFRLTPPPGAHTAPDPIHLHLHSAEIAAEVSLSAAPPGAIDVSVNFMGTNADLLPPKEVNLTFSDPAAGIGPISFDAQLLDSGMWQIGPVTLPTAGPWSLNIAVLVTDFKQITLSGIFTPPKRAARGPFEFIAPCLVIWRQRDGHEQENLVLKGARAGRRGAGY